VLKNTRKKLRSELEASPESREVGAGWISGILALIAALTGLFLVLCLRYPDVLSMRELRGAYDQPLFRVGLHLLLIVAFGLSVISLVLRANKTLGFAAITTTLLATILGGSRVESQHGELVGGAYLGLDWFVLNVVFTGFLFVPIERLFARHKT